jgi:hypothetical protein
MKGSIQMQKIGDVKNIQKVLKEIMGPQDQNKPNFLEKIANIHDHLEKIDQFYMICKKTLNTDASILNQEDISMMELIRARKDALVEEMVTKLGRTRAGYKLNSIDLMFSEKLKQIPVSEIQKMSDYTSGFTENSVVQKLIEFYSRTKT